MKKIVFGRKKFYTRKKTISHDLKGSNLISVLLIKGEYARYDSRFTDREIYEALLEAKEYLDKQKKYWEIGFCFSPDEALCIPSDNHVERPVSLRQFRCSSSAIKLIMRDEYNHALHEFMDCIDDYGHGKDRNLTFNEVALYYCVLNCFIARLEEKMENQAGNLVRGTDKE